MSHVNVDTASELVRFLRKDPNADSSEALRKGFLFRSGEELKLTDKGSIFLRKWAPSATDVVGGN